MITRHKTNAIRRKLRTRAKIARTTELPRLLVYRSNKYMYAQIIDQETGKVLAAESDIKTKKGNKTESAMTVGTALAEKAKKNKLAQVVFDRGAYKFHGRVKAVCEGFRKGGVKV